MQVKIVEGVQKEFGASNGCRRADERRKEDEGGSQNEGGRGESFFKEDNNSDGEWRWRWRRGVEVVGCSTRDILRDFDQELVEFAGRVVGELKLDLGDDPAGRTVFRLCLAGKEQRRAEDVEGRRGAQDNQEE